MNTEKEIREKLEICGAMYLEIQKETPDEIAGANIKDNLNHLQQSIEITAILVTLLSVLDDDALFAKYGAERV